MTANLDELKAALYADFDTVRQNATYSSGELNASYRQTEARIAEQIIAIEQGPRSRIQPA